MILDIKDLTQLQSFRENNDVCIVKYYLPDCAPCRLLAPSFKKLSEDLGVPAAQVLLTDFQKSDFDIEKAPVVEFWKYGAMTHRFSGRELSYLKMKPVLQELQQGEEYNGRSN